MLGYKWNRGGGQNLTMDLNTFFYDSSLPHHDENARYLVPCSPGDDLYDYNFRLVPNPIPGVRPDGTPRTKLTCQEANQSRVCTRERGVFLF